jgi:hypothetical protein
VASASAAGTLATPLENGPIDDPLPVVRRAVRDLLTASPEYGKLDPDRRRELAQSMVRVCYAAASLIREELESEDAVARTAGGPAPVRAVSERRSPERRLARQQGEQVPFGSAAARVASTTRAILNAVSFPQFVTDLINGVFKAMLASSSSQMESYVQLLNAVAASTDGFADSQLGPSRARQWLIEHYPESFELETGELDPEDLEWMTPEEKAEHQAEQRDAKIRRKPNGKPPSDEALKADLGLGPEETVSGADDPERALVPLVRRKLAKNRQEMLATMVMLGMHRIVVESGNISASMRFHIDTRDALNRDDGSQFGLNNTVTASGSFGYGPWGASASVQNTISYVSTSKTQSTAELNTDLELNSSVSINFKSDYVPLNRLATASQARTIAANARNPDAELPNVDMGARRQAQLEGERARRRELEQDLVSGRPAPDKAAMERTAKEAEERRKAAAEEEAKKKAEEEAKQKKAGSSPPGSASPPPPGAKQPADGKPADGGKKPSAAPPPPKDAK